MLPTYHHAEMDSTSAREYYLDIDSLRSVTPSEPDHTTTSHSQCSSQSRSVGCPDRRRSRPAQR